MKRPTSVCITTSEADVWIDEPIQDDEEARAWYKDELGLTPENLRCIFARAREIIAELKPDDDVLDLTYSTGGDWYVSFYRHDVAGRWHIHINRQDPTMPRMQEEAA